MKDFAVGFPILCFVVLVLGVAGYHVWGVGVSLGWFEKESTLGAAVGGTCVMVALSVAPIGLFHLSKLIGWAALNRIDR